MIKKKLKDEYVVFDSKGQSEVWRSEEFWRMAFDPSHPRNQENLGYLVSQYDFDCDWDSWEKHPEGDELVYCISGKIVFILEEKKDLKKILLEPGSFIIVPKNTWHTAQIVEPAQALFVTWGHGTEHRKISK